MPCYVDRLTAAAVLAFRKEGVVLFGQKFKAHTHTKGK